MNKRNFLKNIGAIGLLPLTNQSYFDNRETFLFDTNSYNESDFWKLVRSQYNLHPDFINLENGYYNIIPKPTLAKQIEHINRINLEGSFYMRNNRFEDKSMVTNELSKVVNCPPENLIITRNATESLDLVISGFPWKGKDEAIFALQDYGSMQDMFEQIGKRHNVILKKVSIPNHPLNDEEIVSIYENKITAKTKLIMVSHMINITGQILPVKKICRMAKNYGVQVLVDGAHCVGHFDFKIDELGCDYYGSSLHKWLATPLGAGLLYIKTKHIPNIWPLIADHEKNPKKIQRLSHTGTHPCSTDLSIIDSIEYLNWIGIKRKEKRLHYLKSYWVGALKNNPRIIINTPHDNKRSCGIGNVGIRNMKPDLLAKRLYEEFKIFTVAIDYANVKGCRITPNVFNNTQELDSFISAMQTLADT